MDEGVEIKGLWWLPDTPENQVSGTLSFSPGETISLDLMGMLNEPKRGVLTQDDFINPSIIHGESVNGQPITMERCTQVGGTTGFTGISTTRFSGRFAYVGVHFSNNEQVRFRQLSIGFQNLDEWFSKNAFSIEHPKPNSALVSYEQPAPTKTLVGDYRIDFVSLGPSMSMDRFTHINLSQNARIDISSDTERTIDEYMQIIRHIQNFLTLGMSKPTFVSEIVGTSNSAKNENVFYPIKVYYPANGWIPNSPKLQYFQMIFTLPMIEQELEKILNNWISNAERIKPVYDLYFSTLYNPSIYQEFKFLSLIQAVETYHRQIYGGKYQPDDIFHEGLYKVLVSAIPSDIDQDFRSSLKQGKLRYANEYSLRKRLQLLGEHLTKNLNINFLENQKLRSAFADKVADTRNYFTHYPPELKEKAAKTGKELHELNQKLRLILQVCFLEVLGFSWDKIIEIIKRNREYKDYFS